MVKDLFVNSSIVISFVYIIDLLFQQRPFNRMKPSTIRWTYGVWAGLLGIVLMEFAIRVHNAALIDMRHLATIMAAFTGGAPALAVSSVLMSVGRLTISGISETSLTGAAGILMSGFCCGLIHRYLRGKWRKWLAMAFVCLLIYSAAIFSQIPERRMLTDVFPYFWFYTLLTGILAHSMLLYLRKSRRLIRQLEEHSRTDFLTGLSNVRQFTRKLQEHLHRARQHREQLSLIMLDIDHFKGINDTFGHQAGDEILSAISAIFKSCCRSYDTVSRNGGEEFTVLLPACPHEKAMEIAERIRQRVEQHLFLLPDGQRITVTVSAGVATYPDNVKVPEQLLRKADEALYRAKRGGRNCIG